MRSLGTQLDTAIARTITEPRWFLEIGFNVPVRLTSDVTQTWNSVNWTEAQFSVQGVSWNGTIAHNVSIDLADPDNSLAALALNEKLTNRSVRLWLFQRGNTQPSDVLALPPMKGNDYQGKPFALTITAGNSLERVIPGRTYRTLVPDLLFAENETKIAWGNTTVTIKPRDAL